MLSEANRIKKKHLITLEPAISKQQTNEMRSSELQLVVPKELHASYHEEQRKWLWTLSGFLELVKNQQSKLPAQIHLI